MSDFIVLHPIWLTALLPWIGLFVWLHKQSRSHNLVAPHIAKHLGLLVNSTCGTMKKLLFAAGGVAIIALSGPSFSEQPRPTFNNESARVLIMDMSLSMYATDIKPNRLSTARFKALDLLNQWTEGSTGLVAYASNAYTISPMTTDSQTIANLVPNLSPELMPFPGADASRGIDLAIEMMTNAGLATGQIVLFTDDLDNQEVKEIEKRLQGTSWHLVILGVGSRVGAPIKQPDGSLLTELNGQPIVVKSDFNNMQHLASSVDGHFFPVQIDNSDVEAIAQLDQSASATKNNGLEMRHRINQGYWLLPLLLLPALMLFRRGVFLSALLVMATTTSEPSYADAFKTQDQSAYQDFQAQQYHSAAKQFQNPQWKGIAHYQAGNYQAAIDALELNTSLSGQYNLANAYAQNGQFEQAIELYNRVLQQDPNLHDAQENLEIVEQALQQQQQQGEPDQSQGQDNSGDSHKRSGRQPQPSQSSNSEPSQTQASQQTKNNESYNSREQQMGSNSAQQSDAQKSDLHQKADDNNDNQISASPELPDEQQADSNSKQIPTATNTQQRSVDPELRKLQQVESARDPSQLLRAQILLQAQEQNPPAQTSKKW